MASSTIEQDQPPHPVAAPAGGRRRITEFAPEDAAALAVMFNTSEEGWPGGFMHGVTMTAELVLRRQEAHKPLATFLSWEGDEVAGYCSFFEYPGEPGAAGYVGLLNAATRFHGRGHGRDLLKAALRRAIDRGYRRLDLHTWPGNMKAVPLYKKTGYFWVPESDVHMENYLPLLLGLPALADFWAEADWYSTYRRDLSVKEDLILAGKMRVYPYEFRHGERYVRATIDAAARGLTALETERWSIRCTVDDRRLIVGRPRTVRWEVENRTGRPLRLALLAGAGAGLRLTKEETVDVEHRYVGEATLHAAPDYRPPAFGARAPRVESVVLLDGLPVHLETGVEIKPPVEVRLEGRRVSVTPGVAREVALHVRNNMDEAATARLVLAPSAELRVWPAEGQGDEARAGEAVETVEVAIEPESYGGATLAVLAREAGAHTLDVRGTATAGGATMAVAPVRLPLPAVGPGDLVALTAEAPPADHGEHDIVEREVRVESATHRLIVALREGGFRVEDAQSGADLVGGRLLVGPPFSWPAQSQVTHEATIERRDGTVAVILRGTQPHVPDAVVEHELRLAPDGLLRLETTLLNASGETQEWQGATWVWADRGALPTIVIPTVHGVVASSGVEFPDWGDVELQDPAFFAEGWMARQGDGRVVGVLWAEAARIETGPWMLVQLRHDPGALEAGARRVLAPVYIYVGAGDWRTARARWRTLVRPGAPRHDPPTRDALALTGAAIPDALLAGETNALRLSSMANREASGRLIVDAPAGWEVAPAEQAVANLRVGRPQEVAVAVRAARQGPGAAAVRARLRTARDEEVVFDGAVLALGEAGMGVTVRDERRDGQRVLTVDNGYLRFRLAPAFLGSVIALETVSDGVNHLLSAFPTAREFGYLNPWYGGLHATISPVGRDGFGEIGRLYEEEFAVEERAQAGQGGREWRGLTVRGRLRGKGLRGLELSVTYLTLGGSNLLAARVAVRNHTSATLTVTASLLGYLQPGGTVEGTELLMDPAGRRRFLRTQRTEEMRSADGWASVRDPRSGRALTLVSGSRADEARVEGMDWGTLGGHAAAVFKPRLGPGEERGALAFLALARDEEEARAYRVLTGVEDLP